MKKSELLSVFRALQSGKNRTSLAVVVGVLAMLLLLLSELLPSGNTQKAAVSTAQTATVSQYQAQLEQYRSFSKAMGLEEQTERIYTGRTAGRISPSPQVYAQWQAEQAAKAANRAKERAEKQRRAAQDAAQKGAST